MNFLEQSQYDIYNIKFYSPVGAGVGWKSTAKRKKVLNNLSFNVHIV